MLDGEEIPKPPMWEDYKKKLEPDSILLTMEEILLHLKDFS